MILTLTLEMSRVIQAPQLKGTSNYTGFERLSLDTPVPRLGNDEVSYCNEAGTPHMSSVVGYFVTKMYINFSLGLNIYQFFFTN